MLRKYWVWGLVLGVMMAGGEGHTQTGEENCLRLRNESGVKVLANVCEVAVKYIVCSQTAQDFLCDGKPRTGVLGAGLFTVLGDVYSLGTGKLFWLYCYGSVPDNVRYTQESGLQGGCR